MKSIIGPSHLPEYNSSFHQAPFHLSKTPPSLHEAFHTAHLTDLKFRQVPLIDQFVAPLESKFLLPSLSILKEI